MIVEVNDEEFILPTALPIFTSFNWAGRTEDQGTPDARTHLEAELKKFGVTFGRDSYKLVNIHKVACVLNFEDAKVGKLSGGTDLAIVPYKVAIDSVGPVMCVLFELKPDYQYNTTNGLRDHANQAKLECIASQCISNQPNVLVVLTDLTHDGAITYHIEYDSTENVFVMIERECTLQQMAFMVKQFLQQYNIPNTRYLPKEGNHDVKEQCVLQFKKTKLSQDIGLALEHFYEFQDYCEPGSYDRARLTSDLFSELGYAPPSLTHHSLYI